MKLTKSIKNTLLTLGLVGAMTLTSNAQNVTVKGANVNSSKLGIENNIVELCFTKTDDNGRQFGIILQTTTTVNGRFAIQNGVTEIKNENNLPSDYSVSNNYPNPFNPSTNVDISCKNDATARIEVFNILGQLVHKEEKNLRAGTTTVNINLDGLANGVYIRQITLNNNYVQTNKMLLLYGSNHAQRINTTLASNLQKDIREEKVLLKMSGDTYKLDSVVISGKLGYKRTSFQINKVVSENGTIDIGNITSLTTPIITITGKVYKLMEWPAINGIAGAEVTIGTQKTTTDNQGNYTIQTNQNSKEKVVIKQNNIYERHTRMIAQQNNQIKNFDVVDKTNYTTEIQNFETELTQRDSPRYMTLRWMETAPKFYIVADITTDIGKKRYEIQKNLIQTKLNDLTKSPIYPNGFLANATIEATLNPPIEGTYGTYIIKWSPTVPIGNASTGCVSKLSGEITAAITQYKETLTEAEVDESTIHELITGLTNMNRSNTMSSVLNWSTTQITKYGTNTDKIIQDWIWARPAPNIPNSESTARINYEIDVDDGRYNN